MPPTDDHVLEHVDAYLHEALSPQEADRVRCHLKKCRICQVAMEEAQRRFDALRAVPPIEPANELIAKTWRRIASAPRRRVTLQAKFWAVMA
ncbi:unnamed protein product, partial [marine sediment metagenome]